MRECVDATKNLNRALRQHYGQDRQFLVNVSSPGTDRPLKNRRDLCFHRWQEDRVELPERKAIYPKSI